MKKLTPIHEFNKSGFWLAVIVKRKVMYVVAASKGPKKALEEAKNAGYETASLLKSSKTYAAFSA